MSRPKRGGQIHTVTYAVIFCGVMVVPVAFLFPPLDDRYQEVPPHVATIPPDFSVGPAGWRELYLLKNKPARSREADTQTDLSPEDLYDLVAPSVVTIIVKDENDEPIASGSGLFVDKALLGERYKWLKSDKELARLHNEDGSPTQHGYVLTNYHVIRPAVSADVRLFNGDKGTVLHVVGEDEIADLALLSVSVSSKRPLQTIPLAASNPRILSTVYAIGSPEGLEGTASQGKVSAYRALNGSDHWLQTTTPISSGSSGGPLVSLKGELVGVTTLEHKEGQNLNFAVPASIVQSFFSATNFNLRRRDVAEGASIRSEEFRVFLNLEFPLSFELKNPQRFSSTERHGIELLLEARNAKNTMENAEYNKVITMAEEASTILPDDVKYLAHYIAGEGHIWAAAYEVGGILTTHAQPRYRANKHATAALYHLVEATKLRPDFSPTYRFLFFIQRPCGYWGDAMLTADTLVKLMPRSAEALAMRAECYVEFDQPESAQNDLLSATQLSPRDMFLHIKLAEVLIDLAEYAEAIRSLETAVELCDDSDDSFELCFAQYYLGTAHRRAGNFEKAILILTRAKSNDSFLDDSCDTEIAKCKRSDRWTEHD